MRPGTIGAGTARRKALARAFLSALGVLAGLLWGTGLPAQAQLSPGALSLPHRDLEGNGSCLRCHAPGEGVSAERCLACHRPLAARIKAGRGLHAAPAYASCESCHMEHHGEDFDLVWWGEAGREGFDHALAGFRLEGAHRRLGCRDCHQAAQVREDTALRAAGKDLSRTYLGLGRTCRSCHRDAHRGQFRGKTCQDCHGLESWKPAPGFDHDGTAFPLRGLHRGVPCASCHREVRSRDGTFVRFLGLDFRTCSSCHRDPHQGRLGARCGSCHRTVGWQVGAAEAFDHGRTRFTLRGAHTEIPCAGCHGGGKALRPAFERCTDCHRDPHLGQFRTRSDGGRCDGCHTEATWLPSTYGAAAHQQGAYPLEGAHRAISCDGCHRQEPAELVAPGTPAPRGMEVRRFRFPSTECSACHGNPHAGGIAKAMAPAGCTSCHGLAAWDQVSFDHDRTAMSLEGRHAELACRECHRPDADAAPERGRAAVGLRGLGRECVSCHRDPHRGQFRDRTAGCASCHGTSSWRTVRFDHQRGSRFPLEGAHLRQECAACHLEQRDGEGIFVRYRPLARTCSECHAAQGDAR